PRTHRRRRQDDRGPARDRDQRAARLHGGHRRERRRGPRRDEPRRPGPAPPRHPTARHVGPRALRPGSRGRPVPFVAGGLRDGHQSRARRRAPRPRYRDVHQEAVRSRRAGAIREEVRAAAGREREADALGRRPGLSEAPFHTGLDTLPGDLRALDEVAEAFGVELEHLARGGRPYRRVADGPAEQPDLAKEVARLEGGDLALAVRPVLADARGAPREDEERHRGLALADDRLACPEPPELPPLQPARTRRASALPEAPA